MTAAESRPPPQPIKAVLANRRITQRDLAEAIGHHHVWVNRIVNGAEHPTAEFRAKVAAHLQLPEADLFWPEDHTP